MITMKEYLEAINYRITGGSEHTWDCFGPNSRYLDSNETDDSSSRYSIVCIFDSQDQTVYVLEAWDYTNDRVYRWVNPNYVSAYRKAHKKHKVDYKEASDTNQYIDLDVKKDILEKIRAIVAGEEYDTRVQIEVDFSDEELLQYMKLAHERDMTFNEFVEEALQAAIDNYNRDPELAKTKAQEFLKTHPQYSVGEDIDEE